MKFKYNTFNPYIYNQIPKGARTLDVGCATGLLGKTLKAHKSPKFLVGIEKDKKMAKKASRFYDKVIITNLDQLNNLPFKKDFFDLIVLSDILEHLKNPLFTLKAITPYLNSSGCLLISVPNIAFISVRISLLFGMFEYNLKGGLLDEAHLRLFTRLGLIKLLKQANLKIISLRGYNLVRPRFFFLKILGKLLPTVFSLQFLAKAKKIK
ncbi:hypothetical protein COT75_04990 [Candidatus Beckwithbacteria bacterium CG10_big_fil_rev_8_21_14_0_10_34_10]|uniref:Class I SAM-dependent methyltransferase n=1 Tax=Candidatus Beckwithbacteria bacterium CG10_big_fil_rev_8_21_14_0_10_34_10 TaxID=1974495 RepID=A0A2H0W825_9BACT|nr:MAG: hypothetical protein COT75_04990 [Candidatus Beckwithbacteria bacterium CG10_big_fil_rev_8_21_14_0_10_34_10]